MEDQPTSMIILRNHRFLRKRVVSCGLILKKRQKRCTEICSMQVLCQNYRCSGKSNASTGNMSRHIQKCHSEICEKEAIQERKTDFVFSQENFRDALLKWVVSSSQPFSVVEENEFIELEIGDEEGEEEDD
ncbi:hypothetical protein Bhyg_03353 [Pseudolycoriella hygida]|uniref:BED-type domain-containing protein n=1 Tax=Pseudolycoriella hygida TaxID=35572 RepID=A0A9Q0S8N7_9DIPT|nr:hypothetical protein Bhyg_03353 [Pseudolycoriella hygida]